jgi:signal transduction histidine kinase
LGVGVTDLGIVALHHEETLVMAAQFASRLAALLGFDTANDTCIATAVSEIARNAFRYAAGGEVLFSLDRNGTPPSLVVRIADRGPGIGSLDDVLAGRYRSTTGAGAGIAGARRLMDEFTIESARGRGTTVTMRKRLPASAPPLTEARLDEVRRGLTARASGSLVEEFEHQNQELLRALADLQTRQQELVRLNRELEDTNRGVVALYAELDDRAEHLRRAAELKSRFVSNTTHEFRTPVNSILGLCDLLDRRGDFEETRYIRDAARDLRELVDDLLDLARVEAGKTTVRRETVVITELFGALRGMLKPLLRNQSVALVFDAAPEVPAIVTDGAKVSQILRNLLSNALKFTERGEVRVSVRAAGSGTIEFSVADTGRGIAPEDLPVIFEEFAQVTPIRGASGLGLPLARRLAELLGGSLRVVSTLNAGSTFTLALPIA